MSKSEVTNERTPVSRKIGGKMTYEEFMLENAPKFLAAMIARGDWSVSDDSVEVLEGIAIDTAHRFYNRLAKTL